jgi:uncharacterized membrane protein
LIYISYEDHKLAILGDAGINAVVPKGFWNDIRDNMIDSFKRGNYASGLAQGIEMTGVQLKEHFPVSKDDVDELSNDISFGEDKA